MTDLTPVFVLAIIFGTILAIVYLGVRRKERMAMMEKGVDASMFIAPQKKSSYSLKYGIMLIGIALGILMGKLLATLDAFRFEEEAAYFSMIFLFGGAALVIYHFMAKKMAAEEKDKNELMK
ncbi:MAG: hypothetical protein K9G76_11990 [Bacteroidales bacterium]|nr:hypothetical protein [Bacteroidales bacterium]MCF8405163.1 hypothetical protein [Bacteroidales bacterium]